MIHSNMVPLIVLRPQSLDHERDRSVPVKFNEGEFQVDGLFFKTTRKHKAASF